MRIRRNNRIALGAVAVAALLIGGAFTASNTMPSETRAGSGSVEISGYTASSINYTLDSSDPSTIDSVAVAIVGEVTGGSDAQLQLASAGSWYGCTVGAYDEVDDETPLTCATSGASVDTANNLTLVVAD